jgi:hypothetical protein
MTETIEPQNTSSDELIAKVAEIKKDKKYFNSFEYWAVRKDFEKEAQSTDDLTAQQVDDVLEKLNTYTPNWLSHTFDPHKNKFKHTISSQLLLEDAQERTFIIFTERYPNGIEFIGTHWREIDKMSLANTLIEDAVITALERFNLYDVTKVGDFQKHLRYVLNGFKRYQDIEFGSDTLVNFKNCTLNLNTGITHSHKFDDYLIECLPIDYVDSDDGGLVHEYTKYLLGDEAQTMVEWFGYMFYKDTSTLNHIVFMQGVGGNGKSTLLKAYSRAFGEYASAYTLKELSGDNAGFAMAGLDNKRANIIAETDTYISEEGLTTLKKLTGGRSCDCQSKGKAHVYIHEYS